MITSEKAHCKLVEAIKDRLLQEQQTLNSKDLRIIVSTLYAKEYIGKAIKLLIKDQVLSAPITGDYRILSKGIEIEPNRVCNDCYHHWKVSCVQTFPKLIQLSVTYATSCFKFELNKKEG